MSCSCARALRSIVSSARVPHESSFPIRSNRVQPSIALSGVLSSWDKVARKSSLARFAVASSSARRRRSSSTRRSRLACPSSSAYERDHAAVRVLQFRNEIAIVLFQAVVLVAQHGVRDLKAVTVRVTVGVWNRGWRRLIRQRAPPTRGRPPDRPRCPESRCGQPAARGWSPLAPRVGAGRRARGRLCLVSPSPEIRRRGNARSGASRHPPGPPRSAIAPSRRWPSQTGARVARAVQGLTRDLDPPAERDEIVRGPEGNRPGSTPSGGEGAFLFSSTLFPV